MQPQVLDKVIENVESLFRIASALTRDLDELRASLKQAQQISPAPIERTLGDDFNIHQPEAHRPAIDAFARGAVVEIPYAAEAQRVAPEHVTSRKPMAIDDSVKELLGSVEAAAAGMRQPVTPGERLTQYLSPSVLHGGRGFVQPGQNGLKRYKDDITHGLSALELLEFPDGFYASTAETSEQFFMKTPTFMVLVAGMPDTPRALVYQRGHMGESLDMNDLSRGELLQLSNELDRALSSLPQ